MSKQYEFGFTVVWKRGVVHRFSWYCADGTRLKGRQSYEAWLEFFTPLSSGGGL